MVPLNCVMCSRCRSPALTLPIGSCSTCRVENSGVKYGMTGMRNFVPDRWLKEGERVSIGALNFDILHCPGHSPGSVVYFNEAMRFAHVGDVLFSGSVGRSDIPGGDHATLIKSITDKLLPLGDDVSFICGHGPSFPASDRSGRPIRFLPARCFPPETRYSLLNSWFTSSIPRRSAPG